MFGEGLSNITYPALASHGMLMLRSLVCPYLDLQYARAQIFGVAPEYLDVALEGFTEAITIGPRA